MLLLRLPDAEHGAGRVGDDRHPPGVEDVERLHAARCRPSSEALAALASTSSTVT